MVRVECTQWILLTHKKKKKKKMITIVRIALTIGKKKVVKRSGKKPKCKTSLRGAGALVYLQLSFSPTKGRNSCAAGVRPDAPLSRSGQSCKNNRSSTDSCVCLLGWVDVCSDAADRRSQSVRPWGSTNRHWSEVTTAGVTVHLADTLLYTIWFTSYSVCEDSS